MSHALNENHRSLVVEAMTCGTVVKNPVPLVFWTVAASNPCPPLENSARSQADEADDGRWDDGCPYSSPSTQRDTACVVIGSVNHPDSPVGILKSKNPMETAVLLTTVSVYPSHVR